VYQGIPVREQIIQSAIAVLHSKAEDTRVDYFLLLNSYPASSWPTLPCMWGSKWACRSSQKRRIAVNLCNCMDGSSLLRREINQMDGSSGIFSAPDAAPVYYVSHIGQSQLSSISGAANLWKSTIECSTTTDSCKPLFQTSSVVISSSPTSSHYAYRMSRPY
jgi:hypothetical protein